VSLLLDTSARDLERFGVARPQPIHPIRVTSTSTGMYGTIVLAITREGRMAIFDKPLRSPTIGSLFGVGLAFAVCMALTPLFDPAANWGQGIPLATGISLMLLTKEILPEGADRTGSGLAVMIAVCVTASLAARLILALLR
jgi:hypothetical protein